MLNTRARRRAAVVLCMFGLVGLIGAVVWVSGNRADPGLSGSLSTAYVERASVGRDPDEPGSIAGIDAMSDRDAGLPENEDVGSRRSVASSVAPTEPDRFVVAGREVALQATYGLYGRVELDAILDDLLTLASLPVAAHPDLDYEDDDALAYDLRDAPEGLEVRILVGLQPYHEDDATYRYLQMEVAAAQDAEFLDGALREGPNVHVSISYDVDDPLTPTRFAVMLQRSVDIAACRDAGIDAYHGRFTEGAYYWHDLLDDSKDVSATTFGLLDGQPKHPSAFGGVPLDGDTSLDRERVTALLSQLQLHLTAIRGS